MKPGNTITNIIIIGAGAAGLLAARELLKAGKQVTILEARNRSGGRIHTIHDPSFEQHIELGAEFIHGKLPLTINLLKEAGLDYYSITGEMWQHENAKLSQEDNMIEDWPILMKKLGPLEEDMSVNDFLEKYVPEEKYNKLKDSVRRFAEGYDTAEPDRASILALKEEWIQDATGEDYRPSEGYGKLIEYLSTECAKSGGTIHLNTVVSEIHWKEGEANVITTNGSYSANKVIVTVPLGVLLAEATTVGTIRFSPALPEYKAAMQQLGFGSVIKILLQFKEPFWESEWMTRQTGKKLDDASFVFSKAPIPTWWTQNPVKTSMLTGWLGGPGAAKMSLVSDDDILQAALESLAFIFNLEPDALTHMLSASQVVNWTNDPFTRGSYTYATVNGEAALSLLKTPVANTLYFAGEACESNEAGTVEAALSSGKNVAERILDEKIH